MRAMDHYKRENRRPFPTWSEVLEVLYALGYRRVATPIALPGPHNIPHANDHLGVEAEADKPDSAE
jgi:hypothetical protein